MCYISESEAHRIPGRDWDVSYNQHDLIIEPTKNFNRDYTTKHKYIQVAKVQLLHTLKALATITKKGWWQNTIKKDSKYGILILWTATSYHEQDPNCITLANLQFQATALPFLH